MWRREARLSCGFFTPVALAALKQRLTRNIHNLITIINISIANGKLNAFDQVENLRSWLSIARVDYIIEDFQVYRERASECYIDVATDSAYSGNCSEFTCHSQLLWFVKGFRAGSTIFRARVALIYVSESSLQSNSEFPSDWRWKSSEYSSINVKNRK